MDAAWPERGRPVTVRFGISLPDEKLSTADAAAFLEGLLPHLDALGNEFVNKNTGVPEMSYLVVEDFQTLGLGGDPKWNGSSSPEGERVSDFYWFWRNIGRSGKGGTDRGRWGLGKTVFPATSKINTLFGLTVRREDNRHMLMGQAITKVHELNGKEFVPEGFFCDPATSDELQMPFEDDDTVKRFREAFRAGFGARALNSRPILV